MDPAVTAAVIAVPTAVLAAAAAYAGARSQARSAHRGPVDAVRRQHQRDAYAAFLATLQAYAAATHWTACHGRAMTELIAAGVPRGPGIPEAAIERARELVASVSNDEVVRTGAVVTLEGPDRIAAFANITVGCARRVRIEALLPFSDPSHHMRVITANTELDSAITGFIDAARAHLNDFNA
ncbi:hypothetical protein ACWEFD_18010 [Streptomyces ardesiacus]